MIPPSNPAGEAEPRAGHEQRDAAEGGGELDRGPFEHRQRFVVDLEAFDPQGEGQMATVELVAETAAGAVGLDELPFEQRVDNLRTERRRAAHPPFAFLPITLDQAVAEGFDVVERPRGTQLNRLDHGMGR